MTKLWWIALALAGCGVGADDLSTATSDLSAMPSDAIAAPGDYDGDGCMDIGAKGSNGFWYIKYCRNGVLGAWDAIFQNYGDNTAIPVPADYDGDGLTDLAVKDSTGMWGIDYASNGFGVFDVQVYGYGNALAVPVPADYDGDGMADLSVKDATGMWGVDWASDGFHGWNDTHPAYNYGGSNWIPVPGYYDGNGHCSQTTTQACSLSSQCPSGEKCNLIADLAIKTDTGVWYIDKSSNGLGAPCSFRFCTRPQWDIQVSGYGNASAVPVPADYDHDGYTDLSVKDGGGTWYIDYAAVANTGGACATKPCFGAWNMVPSFNYGAARTAVPGNYTSYDGDAQLDLAAKDNVTGYWYIDNHSNGYTGWELPYIDDVGRASVQYPNDPNITATKLFDPSGTQVLAPNGRYNLTIGVRYTVEVTVAPGNGLLADPLFVEVNTASPQFQVPSFLNLENPFAPTTAAIQSTTHRRFSVECSQPGAGMLGFELRDGSWVFNRDYGIPVACNAPVGYPTGLTGVVTARGCSKATCGTGVGAVCGVSNPDGHYTPGSACPLYHAQVEVPGYTINPISTDSNGRWSLPGVTGSNLTVKVTCPAGVCTSTCSGSSGPRSPTTVFNVAVPAGAGVEIDTPLEEQFFAAGSPHSYTTYIDYSRGRTVFHAVATALSGAALRALQNANANTLVELANLSGAPVVLNGTYFDEGTPRGASVGYFYTGGAASGCAGFASTGTCSGSGQACYVDSTDVWYKHSCQYTSDCAGFGTCSQGKCGNCTTSADCNFGTCTGGVCAVPGQCANGQTCSANRSAEVVTTGSAPMLTIQGMTSGSQSMNIADSDGSFWTSSQFTLVGSPPCPIYNVSPADYAVQGVGTLLQNGVIPAFDPSDVGWARTAVGFNSTNVFYVVADGEGVNGGHGATWHQLGAFFQTELNATKAMMLDSGLSTELVLRGTTMGGTRRINSYAGEDHSWDVDPFADPNPICPGRVGNYFSAGP